MGGGGGRTAAGGVAEKGTLRGSGFGTQVVLSGVEGAGQARICAHHLPVATDTQSSRQM